MSRKKMITAVILVFLMSCVVVVGCSKRNTTTPSTSALSTSTSTSAAIASATPKADEEKLTVRGGLVEGQVLDKKGVEHVANLPSKPQLVAQLIGVIESPIANVIMTMESVLSELAYIIDEASKSRPATSTTTADTAPAQSSATGTESDAAPSAEKSEAGGTAPAAA